MTERIPTAIETTKCPPHYWIIGEMGKARCAKCHKVKNYPNHQSNQSDAYTTPASSVNGGMAKRGKTKQKSN